MKIIRFVSENNKIHFGHNYDNNKAEILNGDILTGLSNSGEKIIVQKLLSPIIPSAILCIGLNYRGHAVEIGAEFPRYPVLFMKNPASVQNPNDPIIIPKSCLSKPEVDYEVELAVIISKAAKNVPAKEAIAYILGYTIANDVSARRWQKNAGAGQWVRGKSFDTFCPLGPSIVTKDEIPDPQNLNITCTLNGRIMQEANTSDMIFSVPELIEYLSSDMTLLPGTVILTGTPSGVGFTRKPPVYLTPGDRIELRIEKIGSLINTVASD